MHQDSLDRITLDDTAIAAHLEAADTAALMLALVHLTGSMDHLRGDISLLQEFLNPDDGLTDEQRARVRAMALEAIAAYRDGGPRDAGEHYMPSREELQEMLGFLTGRELGEDYIEFLTSELSLNGEDPYHQPAIESVAVEQRADFSVLIIGAGMSGLLSAVRLQQAGIPFTVIEKNADVGGTWFENTYPGCRVDSPNHVYSYSFKPKDWPQHYSAQAVLRDYFADTANEYALREHIEFGAEVQQARWDENARRWRVTIAAAGDAAAATREVTANAVISAVGQLNRPRWPDIKGSGSFAGISFHSAQWEHEHDLSGKRVGVIGTGASAFQFLPIVAESAASVTQFQRTPPWMVANPDYFQEVPQSMHWLLRSVPFYAKWFRFAMFWRTAEGLLDAVRADDGWNRGEHSVGELNQAFREALEANLAEQLAERPDLLAACTPSYPPGAKRALIDDGRYLGALQRDNVSLVTDPIAEITPAGVTCASGAQHEFDVLIYATGFQASGFLQPMQIIGADGADLHDVWDDEARAFKGVTMPGFPNLFFCYGPNTNIVVNGSIVFFSECEVRYILGCLALAMEGSGAIDVTRDAFDAYNDWVDEGNRGMAWGRSNVNTWYKNASGHITQNWPFTMLEFWQQTRAVDAANYRSV
ncbi:MAG: NAD(P)/FAD-dependent oxidoreductase [Pseudomonadota bacterium]